MRADARAPAVLAVAPLAVMRADACAPAVLAPVPQAVMRADARAPAVLAGAPLAVMLADARAPAVLAFAPLAVMLADARAPAVLAPVPAAVMLADARAPAVLALTSLSSMRTDAPPATVWALGLGSAVLALLLSRPRPRRLGPCPLCVATRFYASSPGYSPRGSRQRHKSRTHYCVPGRRESACCARTGPATRHSPVGDRSWSLTAISSPTSPALEFNCRLRPPRASTVLRIAPNWTLLPKTVTRSTRSRACGSHSV